MEPIPALVNTPNNQAPSPCTPRRPHTTTTTPLSPAPAPYDTPLVTPTKAGAGYTNTDNNTNGEEGDVGHSDIAREINRMLPSTALNQQQSKEVGEEVTTEGEYAHIIGAINNMLAKFCLLYTSDAADD